jgi:phenol/toluene 2-monooxygenase (NADH) P3/A3
MDKRVEKKRLSHRERYDAMTHDLHWETTYQPMDKVFTLDKYEGLRVHDWQQWQDPLHLTMDSFWKSQGEKDKKIYAVIEAFAQNNGHLGVSDARYLNAIKVLLQVFAPVKYQLHRSLAQASRQLRGDAVRIAHQMQGADNLRHFQEITHAASIYNKYFNGLHHVPDWFDHAWYLQPAKSFADDLASSGPFEVMVASSFCFDALLSDLLFVPYMSGAAHNGDLSVVAAGFSAQSDVARHRNAGIALVSFLIAQDPANLPVIQQWIDKWFWRSFRLMPMVAMMQDYMLPKRMLSWKDAWNEFVEAPVTELFAELAPMGLRLPTGWKQACDSKHHLSHQAWNAFYGFGDALGFHTWVPGSDELRWLDMHYPESFDRWYRPRLDHYAQREAAGKRYTNNALPMQCQVCQQPMMFTETGSPRWIAYRETQHDGEHFHFCSDHCESIFEHAPEKYVQATLASHATLHAHGNSPQPLKATLAGCDMNIGRDSGGFPGSEDDTNFTSWGGGQDMKEAQL